MKKKSTIILLFMILSSALSSGGKHNTTALANLFPSKSEIVMELDSGRILSEYNPDEKLPMASTTKIVTALTVIENYDLKKVIKVSPETTGTEGSSVYLKAGDEFTTLDLLYGLMLRSGNDCAETLAVAVAGSVNGFCEMMNRTAKKYGAESSSFKNPHGLSCDGHYTTARDLCNITRYALKNQTFSTIVATKKYVAEELSGKTKIVWYNKNKLLSSYDGANGVKTGYTEESGKCYAGSAIRNGMQLVGVMLDCPQTYERCKKLFSDAFNNYRMVKIVDRNKFDYVGFTERGMPVKLVIREDFIYPIKRSEKLVCEQILPKTLPIGIKNGEEAGEIKIYSSKQLIFSQKIYTLIDT